jgi:hypothetical protein
MTKRKGIDMRDLLTRWEEATIDDFVFEKGPPLSDADRKLLDSLTPENVWGDLIDGDDVSEEEVWRPS